MGSFTTLRAGAECWKMARTKRVVSPGITDPIRRKSMSPEPTDADGSPSNPTPTAPTGPPERGPAAIRYFDRPDMVENFADSVTGLIFDGQTLRIEFSVTRLDEVKPHAPITGRRYPTCRLVLSPIAAV